MSSQSFQVAHTAPVPELPDASPANFPRQFARTRGFTLGAPRNISVCPDGERVLFLRSGSGTDPVTCLWQLEVGTATETLLADPRSLPDTGEEARRANATEQASRERTRERASGIVSYATDATGETVTFTLAGAVWLVNTRTGELRELPVEKPAFDPRPDPTGTRVAYTRSGALRVVDIESGTEAAVADDEDPDVSWGVAEFIAAEEMRRQRGFWWSPEGGRLLAARVDEGPVQRWYISDPADPASAPTPIAYPAAGTANADVSLWLLDPGGADGLRTAPTRVVWDSGAFPYVVTARWYARALLLVVQSRDQRTMRMLEVDPASGATTLRYEDTDPAWLDIVPGVPAITAGGSLVWASADGDSLRLLVDEEPVTPAGLDVLTVLDVDGDTVLFTAAEEPTQTHVWTYGPGGLTRLSTTPGVHGGCRAGGTTVLTSMSLENEAAETRVLREDTPTTTIASRAQQPHITPSVSLTVGGPRELRTAVVLPSWYREDTGRLPVLMDPYGGPHVRRVQAALPFFRTPQWLADQGFAVVIADGRGTPGRGLAWERAVRGDLAGPVLADQVDALHAAAERFDALDLSRVGIRGWSFGGYLAALAVLRRPDAFHAAVAGAPVTDQRLYDTHYTERYLGLPDEEPENYNRSSLIDDAEKLSRPLMLIHGFADDNVVAAHTLRLSAALMVAGRPHTVLPLSGVTHMTPQEVVAENLLRLQVDFLHDALSAPVNH